MIIVDAGPFNFLIRIGAVEILAKLYGEVFMPHAVAQELSHPRTPGEVREFLKSPPAWMVVGPPQPQIVTLGQRHAGELAVLFQAAQTPHALLMLDDQAARSAASRRGFRYTGTIAVLYAAGLAGCVDFEACLSRLEADSASRSV